MKTADEIIRKYLNFGGDRNMSDFADFFQETIIAKINTTRGSKDYVLLEYVEKKIKRGIQLCEQHGEFYVIIDEQSKEDIEDVLKEGGYLSGQRKSSTKTSPAKRIVRKRKTPKKKKRNNLGKLVDHGNVAPRGKSDMYWGREGIDIVFLPNDTKVRTGDNIPDTYKYADVRFLENYYGIRALEFGNWLSQQDRVNYLSGLGLALFDLHKAIGFTPKQTSIKGRLSVAFGARGRGKALAHFEPGSFAINLTRYSRPPVVKKRSKDFKRVNEILRDGGVGAFAHEYGHALDYYGGLHVEKGDTFSLSGDDSTDTKPNAALLKKNTLHGLMEKLLFKIIWKNNKTYTPYYERLQKAAPGKYHIQRNEIFARAFEVYVQYKLLKKKYKNVFLNKVKYNVKFYLTIAEMKNLEKEFDALINGLKKHL